MVPEVGRDHRSDLAAKCHSDRDANRRQIRAQIRSPLPRHVRFSATHKPWCERPHPFMRGATLRARRRGRSHHGLFINPDAMACSRTAKSAARSRRFCRQVIQRIVDGAWTRSVRLTVSVDRQQTLSKQSRTTYTVDRLSPSPTPCSTPEELPTRGVSCKYWCGSSANSTRPHPRWSWSRRMGACIARRDFAPS